MLTNNKFLIFDLESTGLSVKDDRIVEYAYLIYNNNREEEGSHQLINPTIPITSSAIQKHKITDEQVKNKPTFNLIANSIINHFGGNQKQELRPYILGYNIINYDIPLLNAEFERHGFSFQIDLTKVIDLYVFVNYHFRHLPSNKLEVMYKELFDKEPENAHHAFTDVKLTWEIFCALVEVGLIPDDLNKVLEQQRQFKALIDKERQEFDGWLYYDRQNLNEICLGFGKYKGTPLKEVDKGYLQFIVKKDDGKLSLKVKNILESTLL